MIDMGGAVFEAWTKKEPEKVKQNSESKSDQNIKNELKTKSFIADQLERSYEEVRAKETRQLYKKMEWQAKLKSAENWRRKHCNFVLKARDKIVEGIDNMKRYIGKKYILIDVEEYIEKYGKFIKLKETVRGK